MEKAVQENVVKDLAIKEGDRRWDEANDRLRYSVEYAQAGMKGLFLANGAGIISLLTFVGNSGQIVEPVALWWSFCWFACGIAAILAAYVGAYLSQGYYMLTVFFDSRNAESAAYATGQNYDGSIEERKGDFASGAALFLSIVSLGLFIAGAFVGLDAIT
ncbi:hypothetical protein IM511_08975 [Erythrobacteraceae bacterium E2-1 Yellow Sea]|nr:hypothetical protein [Erythrobacteraceae bacterium E2-1 Yellow Sea]